jgi:G:T-mismatch repair DNA endonuclease (very short patch repair protein)
MKQNVNKIYYGCFFLMQIKESGCQKATVPSDNCQFWQLSYNIEGAY